MKRMLALVLAVLLLFSTALAAGTGFRGFSRKKTYRAQFTDVAKSSWYYQSVADAYELDLMNGSAETTFSPNGNLSVGETIALACRLLSAYTGDGHKFAADTPWYKPYVNYAVEQGLISRGQFSNYDAAAARWEVAVILGALPKAMLSSINEVQNNAIPDVAPGSSYRGAVYTLYRAGILSGSDAQGSFLPKSSILRSEAAAIVARLALPSQRKSFTLAAQPVTLYSDSGDRISVSPGEAMAYEDLGWRRSSFTVPSSGGASAILNAATLRPRVTGTKDLDELVEDILSEILKDSMTTYEKARACYDYLITHTRSGGTVRVTGRGSYQKAGDYAAVLRAQNVLENGTGTSEDYAAAFLVMTRHIGLNCYLFSGEMKSGNSWSSHTWNVVTVGGTDYVFDVQAEDGIAGGGRIQYSRFCKTFSQVSQYYRGYSASEAKASFGNFAK